MTATVLRAARPARSDPTARTVHLNGLERAFGRTFAVIVVLTTLQFWISSKTTAGQTPASLTASLLMTALLGWQAALAFRRPPAQRDLVWLAAGLAVLLLSIRILAAPGSLFLTEVAYQPVAPVAALWAAMSRRLAVPVPVILTVLATGVWHPRGDLAVEQAVTTLATVALAGIAARFMRSGARQADETSTELSRHLAEQDALIAADEARRRATYILHDDVLGVLRSLSNPDPALPWTALIALAKLAVAALTRSSLSDERQGTASLAAVLGKLGADFSPGLEVSYSARGDLIVPASLADAISAAAGEALRNVALHSGVRTAAVTAENDEAGGVLVTVHDDGSGFDPEQVRPGSAGTAGLRNRIADAGGTATFRSAPGEGTTVELRWSPPVPAGVQATDLLAWARRLAPRPMLVFAGFMLPPLLSSLILLILRWQDMRWQLAAAAVYLGLLVLAAGSARSVHRVRMTWQTATVVTAAVIALTAVGALAVAPGTTDAFAYWASGESAVMITVLYFLRGALFGLAVLVLDLAALTAGLAATGNTIPRGAWLGVLAAPALAAGLAAGIRTAFRGLSRYTEAQLAEYGDRLRRQARADAISRVDNAALEKAREVASPVLAAATAGQPPSETLRGDAALASAELRDELLAPGFLTAELTTRLRTLRAAGATVTVNITRGESAAFAQPGRELLTTALAAPGRVSVSLHGYAATSDHPGVLIVRAVTDPASPQLALRQCATGLGAAMTELTDQELLIQLQVSLPE